MDSNPSIHGIRDFIIDIAKIVAISLLIIIPIRYFIVQPFFVRGASMEPNYQQGDYLLVDEISYRFDDPSRGDVIIFQFPQDPSQFYIKRIVGLPGETVSVEGGEVYITDPDTKQRRRLDEDYLRAMNTEGNVTIALQENEYFVLGDNRNASHDSRRWGTLREDLIVGRVFLRAWPFHKFDLIGSPQY